jgi:pyruvate dehydrogenase E1 component
VMVVEACAAADQLVTAGVDADVICLTSPDLVFGAQQGRQGLADHDDGILDVLFPPDRRTPLVTVLDGHPHTLAFLAGIARTPIACLGVQDFGQSGDVQDLYRYFGIDADTIVSAAIDLLG